ncbi:DNA-binding MarR family transcriptional regulator [Thermocatellispora tengchongensis]|uniref:DNA-binding MarR family transcriptional regulator n=1 Tax=Thermocatellispora tengchongensis TaxID=1073253 RepID=A0A840PE82_9ACTN|nr:transcriptional regulator [Thermocatellispora tengchongensis]MBB5139734.1 DNA-binding MarR family transcriptional regulator [Thermocatellispora tengchongensis]
MKVAGSHPRHRLDELIHSPVRFSVMATLASADQAEFGFVRDLVEVSDSVLSKQVALLEEAGYVTVRKGYVGKRPRTWLALTATGREAFHRHVAVLQEIAATAVPKGER